ncbi:hemolysin III [Melghiribacillus thermohalophilus]|uniref:Hemolysin III n=1 Tax=Melghiribacillus thermohalophilus TaxID=1324956 RepID=A0A4R3MTA0_9BACI|nr:hemolysin III family protein [Melghiribacillus thermohalophilus]TCT18056.1 hemolysin III [Melghiribacillus thermohalophilus]
MSEPYSKREELANAITHGLGVLFSIAALIILIIYASQNGSAWQIISVTIYGVTMLLMYLSSTILHSLPPGRWKNFFLMMDHTSIYLFIAGTYTPVSLLLIKGTIGWLLFGLVWGIALLGIVFKMIFLQKFMILSTLLYLLLGWFVVIAWDPLVSSMAYNGVVLLVLGGIFYSVGSIFFMFRIFPYHHAVWHIFVVIGSALHFFSILLYVVA